MVATRGYASAATAKSYARARELPAPVYERFTEGCDTPDLNRAKQWLGELA